MKKLLVLLSVLCVASCATKTGSTSSSSETVSSAGKNMSLRQLFYRVDSIICDTTGKDFGKEDLAYINQYVDSLLAMRNATPEESSEKGLARFYSLSLRNELSIRGYDHSCESQMACIRKKLDEIDNKFIVQDYDNTSVMFNLNGFFDCQRIYSYYDHKVAYLFLELDKNSGGCYKIYLSLSSHFDGCKGLFPVFAFADENEQNEVVERRFSDNIASEGYMFECDNRCFDKFLNKDKMLVVIQDAEGNVDTWPIRLEWFHKQYKEYFGK